MAALWDGVNVPMRKLFRVSFFILDYGSGAHISREKTRKRLISSEYLLILIRSIPPNCPYSSKETTPVHKDPSICPTVDDGSKLDDDAHKELVNR
jgi:hypothetical protein